MTRGASTSALAVAVCVSATSLTAASLSDTCDERHLHEAREQFAREGYTVLRGVLSAEEVDALEAAFDAMTHPSPDLAMKMGRDYADHSQGYDADPADFRLINVNAPNLYSQNFSNNAMLDKARVAAQALLGDSMVLDYMQL